MEVTKPIKVGNVWTNLISGATGESVNFEGVTEWHDGTPMDDSKVDGVIYRKLPSSVGGGYVRRVLSNNIVRASWFGLKGDGSDETVTLQKVFDTVFPSMYVLFDKGTYAYSEHLSISNKSNFTLDFSKGKFLDLSKDAKSNLGVDIRIPVGISFNNCSDFTLKNVETSTNIPAVAVPILSEEYFDQRVPILGMTNCTNVVIDGLGLGGRCGALLLTSMASSVVQVCNSAALHVTSSQNILVKNSYILPGNPGGETYCFTNSKDIKITDCFADNGNSSQTFWSFGKIMECERVEITSLNINSLSPGSLFDFSGDGLYMHNININYPNGKLLDMPGEWGNLFTTFKNVTIRDCTTSGIGITYSFAERDLDLPPPVVENVVVDNLSQVNYSGGTTLNWNQLGGAKEVTFSNMYVKNKVRFISSLSPNPAIGLDYKRSIILNNVKIENDSNLTTFISNPGTVIMNGGSVSMTGVVKGGFVVEDVYSSFNNVPLTDSDYLVTYNGVVFNDVRVLLRSNSVYNDCTFNNCLISSQDLDQTNRVSPNVTFNNCTFNMNHVDSLTDGGSFINLMSIGDVQFKGCKILGTTVDTELLGLIRLNRASSGTLSIEGCVVDVKRYNSGSLVNNEYLIRLYNGATVLSKNITIKGTYINNTQYLVRVHGTGTDTTPVSNLTIENVTFMNGTTPFRCDNGQSLSMYNILIKGLISNKGITAFPTNPLSLIIEGVFTDTSVSNPNSTYRATNGSVFITSTGTYIKQGGDSKTGWIKSRLELSGATADRPVSPSQGQDYYDTTLEKPIWWNGSNWVDATGATV